MLLSEKNCIRMSKYIISSSICSNLSFFEDRIIPDLRYSIVSGMLTSQRHLDINCHKTNKYSIFSDLKYPLIYRKKFNSKTDKKKAFLFCQALLNRGNKVFLKNDNNPPDVINVLDHIDDFKEVWEKYGDRSQTVIIELYQEGDACRIFFKKNHILGIYLVVPAFVIGDGKSFLSSLIEKLIEVRKKNICYSSYPLEKFLMNNNDYIPFENEIVQVGIYKNINLGACYIDLTTLLKDKYKPLIEDVSVILPTSENYTELTFFSRDIFEGPKHESFYISEIQQSSVNLTHLFSCVDNNDLLNELILIIENGNKFIKENNFLFKGILHYSCLKYASPENILRNAAVRMGLSFKNLGAGLSLITELESGRKRAFCYGMSQYTSYIARQASNNKMLTKKLLKESKINTPEGKVFKTSEFDKAIKYIQSSTNIKKWVLKPLQGSGGVGVTTGISTVDELNKAWDACNVLNCKNLILEEEVSGNDYRIVIIQDEIFSVTQRTAAYVIGDGVSCIDQLIKLKAQDRKKNPFYAIKKFEPNQIMLNFLLSKGLSLDFIPEEGEKVQLIDAVNIGSGGESIDRTDEMHPDWRGIAKLARRAIMDAYHVGLDLMANDISRSPFEQDWSIIEVNTNPDLGLVVFPGTGMPRDIGKALIISSFGNLYPKIKKSYELTILGKVQNIGYRKWLKQICDLREIRGEVWNSASRKDVVKAKIYGYEIAVEEVIKLAYKGPKNSGVRHIIVEELDEFKKYHSLKSFEILDTI